MAIEALYPSRRQSRRNNPLFARERRMRRLAVLTAVGLSLIGWAGLRSAPAGAAAASVASAKEVHGDLTAPFALRRVMLREPSPSATPVVKPQHPIRVIPLFDVPEDAAVKGGKVG
jgi:hypothetical protein